MFPIIAVVVLGGAVAVFFLVRARSASSGSIEDRLNELAAMGQAVTLEELELSQPFVERVVIPIIEALSKIMQRFTPQNTLEESRHQIALAGLSQKLQPAQQKL